MQEFKEGDVVVSGFDGDIGTVVNQDGRPVYEQDAIWVRWHSTGSVLWATKNNLKHVFNTSAERSRFFVEWDGEAVLKTIRLLRMFNPSSFSASLDCEIVASIEDHIVSAFKDVNWDEEDNYFSGTCGYWLQFNRYTKSDKPNKVHCTVLVDPSIIMVGFGDSSVFKTFPAQD